MHLWERFQNLGQSDYKSGRVVINQESCGGCKECVQVCPAQALELNSERKARMKDRYDCISCGACMAVCSTDSIRIANFWNFPTGGYKTQGRAQATGDQAFPRKFLA